MQILIVVMLFSAHSFVYILIVTLMLLHWKHNDLGKTHNPTIFLQLSLTPNNMLFPFLQSFW